MIKGFEVKEVQNSKGENIILTPQEYAHAMLMQSNPQLVQFNKEMRNNLGYEISITTLYAISKSIIEQKFFEIAPGDYMPVRVGNGAWSDNILTYRNFSLGGDFEAGNLNTGASNSRLAEADGGVDSILNPVINWGKQVTWTFMDIMMAARSGNWDIVTSKERARKTNWDLGIQSIAFFGSASNTSVQGFLTQSGVTSNTGLITGPISGMNAANFSSLVQNLIQDYRANSNYTAWPTHFTIPESDYNGLGVLIPGSAGTFPRPMLSYLLEVFQMITRNKNFKILPCAYANEAQNANVTGLDKNRYTLSKYDEDSGAMDIPVDYTNTLQNSINGFQFQNVGYGQYTGYLAFRPLEMMYFDYST